MLTNYLAEIWGISLVVICFVLMIKEKHLKKLFSSIETEENMFSWGLTSFVIGISMVLSHNIWVRGWQSIITIIGWLSLAKGLTLLFCPEFIKNHIKKLENSQFLSPLLFMGIILGLIITYFGFTA